MGDSASTTLAPGHLFRHWPVEREFRLGRASRRALSLAASERHADARTMHDFPPVTPCLLSSRSRPLVPCHAMHHRAVRHRHLASAYCLPDRWTIDVQGDSRRIRHHHPASQSVSHNLVVSSTTDTSVISTPLSSSIPLVLNYIRITNKTTPKHHPCHRPSSKPSGCPSRSTS